ncbi:MAG: hypothetical protein E7485_08425 [Ruminococcaceae bacterium]|nr:hypothetical protein [Oscillospiraceae bacterium]
MIIKRNGKPRIVTDKGKVIAEFSKDGTAKVDDKIGAKLVKLGYAEVKEQPLADTPHDTDGGAADDTSGETEAQTSGSE